MEGAVYVLCAATALVCAGLLFQGYWRRRVRLLLWGGLCFVGLTLENVVLFIDVILVPHLDLSTFRVSTAVLGMGVLLYGLVWDVD
jgi:hypothetical protein